MEEFKAKSHAVKKMTRKGLVDVDSKEGTVSESAPKESDGRRINEADFQLERKGAQSRADPADEKPVSDAASRRKKQMVQKGVHDGNGFDEAVVNDGGFSRKLRDHEGQMDMEDLADHKDALKGKQKKCLTYEGQRKQGRLSFGDEGGGMVRGSGTGFGNKAKAGVAGAAGMAGKAAHAKLQSESDENSAVEGAHAGEVLTEEAVGKLREAQARSNRTSGRLMRRGYRQEEYVESKLKFGSPEGGKTGKAAAKEAAQKAEAEAARKKNISRFWQKKKNKEIYRATKAGGKVSAGGGAISASGAVTETLTEKGKRVAKEILFRNKSILFTLGVFGLLFVVVATSLFRCSASIQGGGTLIRVTSYVSTDEDIHEAENIYSALEEALNRQINNMESTHPGYDEYNYQIDEIGHNPYHLISYLTAKYGVWTIDDVRDALQDLFEQQYSLTTQGTHVNDVTTKTVRVGESLGNVVTSGYCNCSICCGRWAGGATASGAMPRANHTIAVDAHNPVVPMGTKIIMNGVEYTVEDTGNFARYGVAFDVYYDSHSAASAHGHKTWEAFIADDNGSREVQVQVVETRSVFNVTLTNGGFDAVARANLDEEQQMIYDALNTTYGNRDYLFDLNTIATLPGGMSYDIPPAALSDARFRNMITEAKKYLGYPYVWGGSSPSTSFDCSGFVSWVINHCGNGWNIGRCTAEGLRGHCTYVAPSQAKPGDLIFFERTYNTSGASHVGIYCGDGVMIHCGNPIQFANINSSYWQQHFMCFGRLP